MGGAWRGMKSHGGAWKIDGTTVCSKRNGESFPYRHSHMSVPPCDVKSRNICSWVYPAATNKVLGGNRVCHMMSHAKSLAGIVHTLRVVNRTISHLCAPH